MSLSTHIAQNVRAARFGAHELSGALGDLGTFLPLLVALTQKSGLDFGTALFFSGLWAAVTGAGFGLPMAVQPMKAIAAVAVAEGLGAGEVAAAGLLVGATVLLLGLLGLIDLVARCVPRPVVRGIQLGLGLSLVTQGARAILASGGWAQLDGYGAAIAAALVILVAAREGSRLPAALLVFAAGVAMTAWTAPEAWRALDFAPGLPGLAPPTAADFARAHLAAIPQLPLTLLNSVVAVCALSAELYPKQPAPPRAVAISVGLMNVVGAPFGAMPLCHGAGGLAAQHRFGARTGGALLALGAAEMVLAILFGASLLGLARAFPQSLLGAMLIFAGLELGGVATRAPDLARPRDGLVALAVAGISLGFGSAAIGTAVGLVLVALNALLARSPRRS